MFEARGGGVYSALIFLRGLLWQSAFTVPYIACSDSICWLNLPPNPVISHSVQVLQPPVKLCPGSAFPWDSQLVRQSTTWAPSVCSRGLSLLWCPGAEADPHCSSSMHLRCDWALPPSGSRFLKEVFKALLHPMEWESGQNSSDLFYSENLALLVENWKPNPAVWPCVLLGIVSELDFV